MLMMCLTFMSFVNTPEPNCKPTPTRRATPRPITTPICKDNDNNIYPNHMR